MGNGERWTIYLAPEQAPYASHVWAGHEQAEHPGFERVEVVPADQLQGAVALAERQQHRADALLALYKEAVGHGPSTADYLRASRALDGGQ